MINKLKKRRRKKMKNAAVVATTTLSIISAILASFAVYSACLLGQDKK